MKSLSQKPPTPISKSRKEKHADFNNYKKLIDSSLDIICTLNEEGKFVFVSDASRKVWGYTPDELQGRSYAEFVVEEDLEMTAQESLKVMSGVDITNFQNRYKRKDQTVIPILWSARWDEADRLIYCVAKDATEKNNAEKAARENEERLKRAYKLSKIGWWEWDMKRNSYQCSDELYQIYGLKREEVPFISFEVFASLVHPEDLANVTKVMSQLDGATYNELEHRLIKPSGEIIYLLQCSNIEKNVDGEVIRIHGTTKDVTEKVLLQRRIIEEKITAQKEIAKAIIDTQERERSEIGKELHDNVNQVLTTVKLYIENIRNYPEMREAFIDKSIVLAQRAINEIRFLAKQLVTPVMKDLGFEATILELVEHYQSLNKFLISLDLNTREHHIEQGMRLTIYRILQEQLNNIVKYAEATEVNLSIVYHKGHIRVKVIDNGIGFDPAKTILGLGLNNIKNRAEVYKGKVQLKSSVGKGCALLISFPILECRDTDTHTGF